MAIHVREKPPLRQHLEAKTPGGRYYRWGEDEPKPENVFSGLRDSSTMPGGYESCDVVLPRLPNVDYADLERLTTLRIIGAGGHVDGEFRLEGAPKVSGDNMVVSPSAVGWQAHLDDDKSALMAYVSRTLSDWGEGPLTRIAALSAANIGTGEISREQKEGGWVVSLQNVQHPAFTIHELWWRGPAGMKISKVMYRGGATSTPGTWIQGFLGSETDGGDETVSTILSTTLDNTIRTVTLPTPRRHVYHKYYSNGNAATPSVGASLRLDLLGVYGDSGIPTVAVAGDLDGVLASDVVAHAVSTWAPLLQIKPDSIQPSGFPIPHLAFLDLTTAAEIVRQASRFNLPDWGVWDDREFVWHARGARGKRWRARIGPSQLEETGPRVDRLWESIVVSYQDVDGSTRFVGPPGSGMDTESALLKDPDPDNPANRRGLTRRDLLVMRTGTAASAVEVGARFLELSKLLDSSGRAQIVGYIEDDRGVLHPYSQVRAGDEISFIDSNDKSYRRIVRADHTRETRTCSIDLDAPPEGLDQLLERLDVELVKFGIG